LCGAVRLQTIDDMDKAVDRGMAMLDIGVLESTAARAGTGAPIAAAM
jgi:hypothetical protein